MKGTWTYWGYEGVQLDILAINEIELIKGDDESKLNEFNEQIQYRIGQMKYRKEKLL